MTGQVTVETLNYEQAFDELEAIIHALETDGASLEEAIALFERGQALVQYCGGLLDQAELRIRQLTERNQDEPCEDEEED